MPVSDVRVVQSAARLIDAQLGSELGVRSIQILAVELREDARIGKSTADNEGVAHDRVLLGRGSAIFIAASLVDHLAHVVQKASELHPVRQPHLTEALRRLEEVHQVRQAHVWIRDVDEPTQRIDCFPDSHLKLELAVLLAQALHVLEGLLRAHLSVQVAHGCRSVHVVCAESGRGLGMFIKPNLGVLVPGRLKAALRQGLKHLRALERDVRLHIA
mmetsp:Transcript_36532/g.88957  ORF Transcript_36532/g.88957 Transcript_36532/m.88957 type:complete len:216 (-) Transcript_36532:911-1558(-)